MTLADRIQAVESLGFSQRQAHFITTVALHGGYCMRRQYLKFSGLRYGKNVRDFLDGLVERRLAQRQLFAPNRGYVYHLHAKSLYRQLEQPENRNRRVATSALIARKVMLLDTVLAWPDADWYATEDDKVRLFTERFQLPVEILPRRIFLADKLGGRSTTRYFIDKLPICATPDPAAVYFVYLPLDQTTAGFQHFLMDYAELLARLPAWRIVLARPRVSAPVAMFFSVFERFRNGALLPPSASSASDLSWYFRSKEMVERGDVASFTGDEIDRFRRLRERFGGSAYRALYCDWLARRDAALQTLREGVRLPDTCDGGLFVYDLPSRYRQFGSLPGIA